MKIGLAALGTLLLAASACGTSVRHVHGPAGEDARLISCYSTADCYEKAYRICPAGYVIRSNGTIVSGVASKNGGAVFSRSEVLVSCKDDLPEGTVTETAATDHADSHVCEMAFERAGDFATYWADHTPNAKRLDEMPKSHDFVSVCHEMSERVQRCFHSGYRTVHAKACDAVLLRMEPGERAKVDGLFLEAPGPGGADGGA